MILLLFVIAFASAYDLVVEIKDGKIGGEILPDYNGNDYFSFQSIPFAKPPIGNLRFRAPVKNDKWNGTLNATKVSPFCPQGGGWMGQEDCLYLNVYTPKITGKLPVMFFIHGGLFRDGSGSLAAYGPEFLMPRNIVLVTINYRLGYLGGLSFKNQSLGVPGNAHLKDQVMALKWVQANIRNFGGNRKRVTIFGHSVGGGSVNMHLLSPMTRGLFHRAISQSGWALTPWMEGYVGTGEVLAKKAGINTDSEEIMIKELQKLSMHEILDKQDKYSLVAVDKRMDFMPVIETQTNEPAYLNKHPIDIIKSGNFMKVPYMMGFTNKECIVLHVASYKYFKKPFCLDNYEEYIPYDVMVNNSTRQNIAKSLRDTFVKDNRTDDIETCTDLCDGTWFIAAFYRTLVLMMHHTNTPIYAYRFSADTNLNFLKKATPITKNLKGASHMEDLGYLFQTPLTPRIKKGSIEERIMKRMVKLWTNFAKTGRSNKKWLPVKNCKFYYLEINRNLTLRLYPEPKVLNFWSKIYERYNGDKPFCDRY